jgi:hypothetical protein
MRIARQVELYGQNQFLPPSFDPPNVLHPAVKRYTDKSEYAKLEPGVSEQILMDQLALVTASGGSLEQEPDRLTVGRLNDLFGHCLCRSEIDLEWPKDKQIARLLESTDPYIALVRNRRFESMLRREDGERLIIRELYEQLRQMSSTKAPPVAVETT